VNNSDAAAATALTSALSVLSPAARRVLGVSSLGVRPSRRPVFHTLPPRHSLSLSTLIDRTLCPGTWQVNGLTVGNAQGSPVRSTVREGVIFR